MDSDSIIFVEADTFLSRRHHAPLKNSATEMIAKIMSTSSFDPKGGFGRGRGRGRGRDGRRTHLAEGKRPLLANKEDYSRRALESACNKLSYANFDKLYPIILGFVKSIEGTMTFLIRRGSESGSFAELYIRIF